MVGIFVEVVGKVCVYGTFFMECRLWKRILSEGEAALTFKVDLRNFNASFSTALPLMLAGKPFLIHSFLFSFDGIFVTAWYL